MIGQLPPFALGTPSFRFRALASHAGRASLGGDREVALACFVSARLASGLLQPLSLLAPEAAARSAGARQWLASLTLPAQVRSCVAAVIDATAETNGVATARALANLMLLVLPQLDEASFAELRELADVLAHDSTEFRVEDVLPR